MHSITTEQLHEMINRLNAITVTGLSNSAHLIAIAGMLEQIAKPPKEDAEHKPDLKVVGE